MALIANVSLIDNFQEQITFLNAYIRIEKVLATRVGSTIDVIVFRQKDGQQLARKSYDFSAELEPGENHLRQAYLHLKTLSDFSDATDC